MICFGQFGASQELIDASSYNVHDVEINLVNYVVLVGGRGFNLQNSDYFNHILNTLHSFSRGFSFLLSFPFYYRFKLDIRLQS